jgi:NTP pyrophosphatase (non-canonical NTP hydrolase)
MSKTIKELEKYVLQFEKDRDWSKYHSTKDLAIGIVTEGCELLELLRSKTNEEIAEMLKNPKKREMIEDELADTFAYILLFSGKNDIDLEKAYLNKLKKTEAKYPVEKYKGHWEKPGRE